MSDTLQPYDGATRVRLPYGTECWEKHTRIKEMGGFASRYQYSVQIPDTVARDYDGRVIGLKMRAHNGKWYEVVSFFPVTDDLITDVRGVIERGWSNFSVMQNGSRYVDSFSYLRITGDVMALLEATKP